MPWENRGVMSMREEFVIRAREKEKSISRLCREYNISRYTAYKWINRYTKEGLIGLHDRSKRPLQMPSMINNDMVQIILSLRNKYPAWGAKKIRQLLINEGYTDLPSLSSFNRILQRHDMINPTEGEKRQRFIRFEKQNPNELWQMDFKGHFLMKEGVCHPLTILDDCSRYSICLKACTSESEGAVRSNLELSFRHYGLPIAMTMDNGSP